MSIFTCIIFNLFLFLIHSKTQSNVAQTTRILYSKYPQGEINYEPIKTTTSNRFYYNYGATCTDRCRMNQADMTDIDSCLEKCSEQSKFRMIMSEIFIGVIVLMIIILIIYTEGCRYSQNSPHNSQDLDIAQRKIIKQQYFDGQIVLRNKVCTTNISEQQFQSFAKQFSECKWIFKCTVNQNPHFIRNYSIQMKKLDHFIYELIIGGIYELGTWSMNGFYLNTQRGIQLWAMKNYDHPDYAGQAQQWDRLMFDGAKNENENYQGKWYYVGFQNNPQYCSKWSMEAPNTLKELKDIKDLKQISLQ